MTKKIFCLLLTFIFIFTCLPNALAEDSKIKVACIGDSITFGYGLADRDTQSYPAQLQQALGENYDVENFGVSAYCVLKNSKRPYWEREEYANSLKFKADIVIIMLGTNDIKTENWEAVERNNYIAGKDYFVSDYSDLIASYRNENPNAKIYVVTPPPIYLDENDTERPPLNLRNYGVPLIKEVAEKNNCILIDVFSLLDNKADLFEDKLHPNSEGAKIISDAVLSKIKQYETAQKWSENFKSIPAFSEPSAELTREEFAYIIVKTFGFKNNADVKSSFTDISDSIYKDDIQAAFSNEIIKGVSDTSFNPKGKITRQEITLMLYRVWQKLYSDESFEVTDKYEFSDSDKISDWAMEAVLYMYSRKIMLGTSSEIPTISPLNNISKEHSLLLMERIIDYCIKNK